MTSDLTMDSEAFAGRLLQSGLGFLEVLSVYLGDRLGLYRALAGAPSVTAVELAAKAGCNERYIREWLEQQAVGGILTVVGAARDASARRYALPAGAAEVLTDGDSLNYMAPMTRTMTSLVGAMPALLEAFRSGGGVPWSAYGVDAREGQADSNKPVFFKLLNGWLDQVPAVGERLRAEPAARVADIGCGAGWSSIALAQHYPRALIDGYDLDEASIKQAKALLAGTPFGDRVTFHCKDAAGDELSERYDLALIFEALHDMSRPVEVLRAAKRLLAPGGSVVVIDERVAESFTAPGDEIERLMYGWSVLCCLPAGMSETPSMQTGTVMRPATLRRYAAEAGFSGVEVVEVDHPFFRLYHLIP